mmetsp:Transcript_16602/g.18798  ORF Transcript_16602/g.18798 Transcript_16602/m.18798 type:complete len:664 (+) Transcript_16602:178-2169(+)|eukprot:CAMPEP_0184021174 /NCGR_PEP_ID=MMETSP0954-20121128/9770_1 /TAXON_ID=627963 /ORGANISM="Aplanochytrium sp, Strain PBS07" /LENGTH=663 /DNA_ID=CAMNT_0026303141 /DNA_START=379 /DNA_END=2370 /DNA_ORIENTATION=+
MSSETQPPPNAWGKPPKVSAEPVVPAAGSNATIHKTEKSMDRKEPMADSSTNAANKSNTESQVENAAMSALPGGPKSWAEIARDPHAPAPAEAVDGEASQLAQSQFHDGSANQRFENGGNGNNPEYHQVMNQQQTNINQPNQRFGGHQGRGGKWTNNRNAHHSRSSPMNRPAGRRGLTYGDLQHQAQQLMMVQRLVGLANQMRVDPNYLYQAQMQQYAAYYGNYAPVNYPTPGSIPLDDHSYPQLQLLSMYPHLTSINQTQVMTNPSHARYVVYRLENELEAHHGIKYNQIFVEDKFAPMLNKAFGEVSGLGPLYIFFIFPSARRCIGVAEMTYAAVKRTDGAETNASEPADSQEVSQTETEAGSKPEKSDEGTKDDAKPGPDKNSMVQVRWICVKDIHLGVFKRVRMLLPPVTMKSMEEALPTEDDNNDKSTESENQAKDSNPEKKSAMYDDLPNMYLLDVDVGPTALQIVLEQNVTSTLLLDFKMFDEAEANNGKMPSYYRSGVSTHSYQHNRFQNNSQFYSRGGHQGRGRGGYSRGRGGATYRDKNHNNEKGNNYNGNYKGNRRGRGDMHNSGARGRGRGRGGRGGRYSQAHGNKVTEHVENSDRPRRLAAGDGTEIVIQKEYQFPIQQKKGKKPKAKKGEKADESAQAQDNQVEATTDK